MWSEWLQRFVLSMRKRNFSERTLRDYPCQLGFFFRFLADRGIDTLSRVTRDVLHDYQSYLYYYEKKGKKLSFATQRSRLDDRAVFFPLSCPGGFSSL